MHIPVRACRLRSRAPRRQAFRLCIRDLFEVSPLGLALLLLAAIRLNPSYFSQDNWRPHILIQECILHFVLTTKWNVAILYRDNSILLQEHRKERYRNGNSGKGPLHQARSSSIVVDLTAESRLPNCQPAASYAANRAARVDSSRVHRPIRSCGPRVNPLNGCGNSVGKAVRCLRHREFF